MNLGPLLIGVHHVPGAGGGAAEEAHVLRPASPRDDGDHRVLVPVPLVEGAALLQVLHVGDQREEREHHVVRGDREIVHAGGVGRVEPDLVHHRAGVVDFVEHHVGRAVALGLVREGQQPVVDDVHLGMGAHRHRLDLAAIVEPAPGLQGVGVDLVGEVVLLQHQRLSGVEDGVGVGRAHVGAGHARVVGVAVAVTAEEAASRLLLQHEPFGADPAAPVVDLLPVEAEHVHHALAVDEDVVPVHRRILAVGSRPVPGPLQRRGELARDQLEAPDVGFGAQRLSPALVERDIREADLHGRPPTGPFQPLVRRAFGLGRSDENLSQIDEGSMNLSIQISAVTPPEGREGCAQSRQAPR